MKVPLNGPTVLAVRVVEFLEVTRQERGTRQEPQWSQALIQRVLGAVGEVILDAVTNGEEIQFGKLGKFFPRVLSERTVSTNFLDGEKVKLPKRVKLGFDSYATADDRVGKMLALIETITGEPLPRSDANDESDGIQAAG